MFVKHSYILCIVIVFISSVDVIAQITPTKSPPVICDEYSELEEKNKNYVIEVSPTNLMTPPSYGHKETVVVCDFNNTLKLKKKDGGMVPNVTWVKGGVPTSNPLVATTSAANFTRGKNKIVVEIEGEKDLVLFLKIVESISVSGSTNDVAEYGFDSNLISSYPAYSRNFPIKFLPKGELDLAVIDSSPNRKASNHITITSSNADLFIDPVKILESTDGKIEHELSLSATASNVLFDIHTCSGKLYELETDVKKTLNVDLYILSESDDDIINYCHDEDGDGIFFEIGQTPPDFDGALMPDCKTPIPAIDPNTGSPYECIHSGLDGSLDLYFQTDSGQFWKSKLNDPARKIDVLHASSKFSDLVVKPSYDLVNYPSTPRFCNNRPLTNHIEAPPGLLSKANLESELDKIYAKIGIDINVNIINKPDNYDIISDDNKMHISELLLYHIKESVGSIQESIIPMPTTTVWYINEIIGGGIGHQHGFSTSTKNSGSADVLYNSLALGNTAPVLELIMAHEIGHAKYELWHPDDHTHSWNSVDPQFSSDDYNFMNSGEILKLDQDLQKFRLRQYQWVLIHENH